MEEKAASGLPMAVPCLVIPHGEGKKNHAFYNISEPENTSCRNFIPELSGKTFWQKPSHQGWLNVLCDAKDDNAYIDDVDLEFSNVHIEKDIKPIHKWRYGDCFLWHPVTLEIIQLPSLLEWISKPDDYHLIDCVLSSPPGICCDGPDGEGPIVLFLFLRENTRFDHVFLFCLPGDKNWRTQLYAQDTICEVQSLHCFKGKLYVIGFNEQQLEIAQQQLGASDNNVALSIKPFNVSFCTSLPFRGARDTSTSLIYRVECSDELYKIRMFITERGFEKVVISIHITKLDFSLMVWKEVNTLGDHVLFIGQNTTVCCSAAELGLARGCLYYTIPEDQRLYKFEVESAGDSVTLPCPELPSPDWIMMPAGHRRKGFELGADEKDQVFIKTCEKRIYTNYCDEIEDENDRKLEERKPWDILNEDMVKLIADYLHPLDYVHFRPVCKTNRERMPVVKPTFTSATRITEAACLSLWLIYSRDNNLNIYNLVNPVHNNEIYLMKFPEMLLEATIRYQKGGWLLLLLREEELYFYNPFTRDTIKLPDFPGRSFSSLPTSSDCIVFGIDFSFHGIYIFCIRRGGTTMG